MRRVGEWVRLSSLTRRRRVRLESLTDRPPQPVTRAPYRRTNSSVNNQCPLVGASKLGERTVSPPQV